ncbi:hypothetical protein CANMA_000508 [Candida margitis]|uniref:uncharacterized protein n=1 Tax=Candida margitis TaxID=1775924 RepID=UPI0022267B60|nr:uncharacterized protein CANMA_000508 [Candida margitis]KAI5970457.1 hypothetical protein CANMA_000508 [Candida margitis]
MFFSSSDQRESDNSKLRPRKYSNKIPPLHSNGPISAETKPRDDPFGFNRRYGLDLNDQRNSLEKGSRYPSSSAIWDRDNQSLGDFGNIFGLGKHFIGFDESFHMNEKNDRYLVSYVDAGLKQDDIQVDFNQEENELIICIDHEDNTDTGASTKSYQSKMKFDKPIKVDEIKAEIDDNGVQMVLPKAHADNENFHHIPMIHKPPLSRLR